MLRAPSPRVDLIERVIACLAILLTRVAYGGAALGSFQNLAGLFPASSLIMLGIWYGWRGGLGASLAISAADLLQGGTPGFATISVVLIRLSAATAIGYAVDLAWASYGALGAAQRVERVATQALDRSREVAERLLQSLTLIEREAMELGPQALRISAVSGSSARLLRTWLHGGPTGAVIDVLDGDVDLRAGLAGVVPPGFALSTPRMPVVVPRVIAEELLEATREVLDNVTRHAGAAAEAAVLLVDDGLDVTVRIRDRGTGFVPGVLAPSQAIGLSLSVRQRVEDAGGSVFVSSIPGLGTTVEITLPTRRDAVSLDDAG